MHCYVCYWYVFVAKIISGSVFLSLDTYQPDTLYLREQGCKDPYLFFEAKRDPQAKRLGDFGLEECCMNRGTSLH